MFLDKIAGVVSMPYRWIPGDNLQEKVTFVGMRALDTLPWVAASYYLDRQLTTLIPARFHPECLRLLLPAVGTLTPWPFSQVFIGMGIMDGFDKFYGYSTKLFEASCKNPTEFSTRVSNWSDRLHYLLLTFSAIIIAYNFFKMMLPKEKIKKSEITEAYPTPFTVEIIGAGLALQLRYAFKPTLAGIVLGALYRPLRHVLTFDYLSQKLDDSLQTEFRENEKLRLAFKIIGKFFRPFYKKNAPFSNPVSTAQKCYRVWEAFLFVATSISTPFMAFVGGFMQGQLVTAPFSSYLGETPPPAPTETNSSSEESDEDDFSFGIRESDIEDNETPFTPEKLKEIFLGVFDKNDFEEIPPPDPMGRKLLKEIVSEDPD